MRNILMCAAVAALLGSTAAAVEVPCAPHAQMKQLLEKKYGEEPHAGGLIKNSRRMEVFVSEKSGSWTILVTRVDGEACIAASGEKWEELPEMAAATSPDI